MSIIRLEKQDEPFAIVRKQILADARLSFKAKGILAYLLCHSDNWEVRVGDLVKRGTDGRDSIYAGLKELRQCGYAKIETKRVKGVIIAKDWVIRNYSILEDSSNSPNPDYPDKAKPNQAKPDPTKYREDFTKKKRDYHARSARRGGSSLSLSLGLDAHRNGDEPLHKFSESVNTFAQFAQKKKFHIVSIDPKTGKAQYCRGAGAGGFTRQTLATWQGRYLALREQDYSSKRILQVLEWWIRNHGRAFMTTARTFSVWCEKFDKIEAGMRNESASENGGQDPYEDEMDRVRRDPNYIPVHAIHRDAKGKIIKETFDGKVVNRNEDH